MEKDVSKFTRDELIDYLIETWHEVSDNLPDDISVKRKFFSQTSSTFRLRNIVRQLINNRPLPNQLVQ
jgi:hypothetical protein